MASQVIYEVEAETLTGKPTRVVNVASTSSVTTSVVNGSRFFLMDLLNGSTEPTLVSLANLIGSPIIFIWEYVSEGDYYRVKIDINLTIDNFLIVESATGFVGKTNRIDLRLPPGR